MKVQNPECLIILQKAQLDKKGTIPTAIAVQIRDYLQQFTADLEAEFLTTKNKLIDELFEAKDKIKEYEDYIKNNNLNFPF